MIIGQYLKKEEKQDKPTTEQTKEKRAQRKRKAIQEESKEFVPIKKGKSTQGKMRQKKTKTPPVEEVDQPKQTKRKKV